MLPTVDESKSYPIVLGESMYELEQESASALDRSEFACFRYDFLPASIDKSVSGLVEKQREVVTVQLKKNSGGGGLQFRGKSTPTKPTDCLLIFDEENQQFVLENVHIECTNLRHLRTTGTRTSSSSKSSDKGKQPLQMVRKDKTILKKKPRVKLLK